MMHANKITKPTARFSICQTKSYIVYFANGAEHSHISSLLQNYVVAVFCFNSFTA